VRKKRIERHASILQDERCSFFNEDRTTDLVLHHIFNGVAYRHKCDEDGLWVWLSPDVHEYIHSTAEGGEILRYLKRLGQQAYEKTHSREEFMERYGKSYL